MTVTTFVGVVLDAIELLHGRNAGAISVLIFCGHLALLWFLGDVDTIMNLDLGDLGLCLRLVADLLLHLVDLVDDAGACRDSAVLPCASLTRLITATDGADL